MAIEINTTEFV